MKKEFIDRKHQELQKRKFANDRIVHASNNEVETIIKELETSLSGLTEDEAELKEKEFGKNIVTQGKKVPLIKRIFAAFVNPFTAILIAIAIVSCITNVILAPSGEKDPTTMIIIITMILISGVLRFVQETRSGNAAAKLSEMVKTTTCVQRLDVGKEEILLEEVVVGDIIHLAAGDMVPADIRIIYAKDLFISQSALTGESEPLEKISLVSQKDYDLTDLPNIAFMGSTVISGSAQAVAISTGNDTMLGTMAKTLASPKIATSFEKGVNSVSWVLIRFMLVMVPVVFFINGFTKGNWMSGFTFALSVAIGLTPEMLPMIVTTCLAKGAVAMSQKKTIIKNLNSIQNFGSIDVLCTDKTGTLTQDKVVLEYHLNVHGNNDGRVLRHGFLNSYYQTGLKNLMDIAIIRHMDDNGVEGKSLKVLADMYTKVDEIPFDFVRRRMSVVVEDGNGKTQMITKGAVEEMLSICNYAEYSGSVSELTSEIKKEILETVDEFNEKGMRVVAVAQKNNPSPVGAFSVADEKNMVLMGYLAFLDPPKETTKNAISALKDYGVVTKILTGDNDKVTRCICKQVGLEVDNLLLGSDVEEMSDDVLSIKVEETNVFAKLSPTQKARIVTILRNNGHVVGYMGDGINDAAAMKASDVGISVDTAVDIAKESADIILLEKDLMVLEEGIIEGRKTYANMIKYIKMTASSNFGNMFSVLIASAFLPFFPMAAVQLIILNLIYDISCTAIPWDNVDVEYLQKPRKWNANSIGKFMIWIGPTSSIFDITTFLLMYFVLCPMLCGGQLFTDITNHTTQLLYISIFQAGWFVESMWTQTLVIHMIRTPKIPFIQSRASFPVFALTFTGIACLTLIPFTGFGTILGLAPLPLFYFVGLAITVVLYMFFATAMKKIYIKRYGELL